MTLHGALPLIALSGFLTLSACGPRRDFVPESRDSVGDESTRDSGAPDAYAHVVKRRFAVVGLAEARGISHAEAVKATEKIAASLDACVASLDREGTLTSGAARVLAIVGDGGDVVQVASAPTNETGVARVVVLCFVAPIKALGFSPAAPSSVRRGMAFEATWHGAAAKP